MALRRSGVSPTRLGRAGVRLYVVVHGRTLKAVSRTMTVSEARAALAEILDRVEAGEEVTITRHGRPRPPQTKPPRRPSGTGSSVSRACSRPGQPLSTGLTASDLVGEGGFEPPASASRRLVTGLSTAAVLRRNGL